MSGLNSKIVLPKYDPGRGPSNQRILRPMLIRPTNNIAKGKQNAKTLKTLPRINENDENVEPSGKCSNKATTEVFDERANSAGAALVYLRFRPTKDKDAAFQIQGNVLSVGPSKTQNKANKMTQAAMVKEYKFTDIFHTDIPQADVYENCVRLKIDMEESFTLLAYGTSGSGKTYTQLGTATQPGIIPRSLEHIFNLYGKKIYPEPSVRILNGRIVIVDDRDLQPQLELRKLLLQDCPAESDATGDLIRRQHDFKDSHLDHENISVFIWINFVELYNESCYDLLAGRLDNGPQSSQASEPSHRNSLKMICSDGKVYVKSLNSVFVKSGVEALHLLKRGMQQASYAATGINATSSRSHCIFTIDVLKYDRCGNRSHICYRFCDLAGSERLHKTGNVGQRLKESQSINASLLVLSRCLDAAAANSGRIKKTVVPVRESKLTMLLQAALLGKEQLSMIVNMMPADEYYEENINILGFASLTRNIVFKQQAPKSRCSFLADMLRRAALVAENVSLRSQVDGLKKLVENLKTEQSLEFGHFEQDLREKLTKMHDDVTQEELRKSEEKFQNELAQKMSHWRLKYDTLKRKLKCEIDELQAQINACKNQRYETSYDGDNEDDGNDGNDSSVILVDDGTDDATTDEPSIVEID